MTRGPWIQTYTGRQFFPLSPEPEDVCPVDIAHALSCQARFSGHTRGGPYSVAQHSLLVASAVPAWFRLAALLHDAAEAYLVDLPRPLKHGTYIGPHFAAFEARIARAIGERFDVFLDPTAPDVHVADMRALATERRDLMMPEPAQWGDLPPPLEERVEPVVWHEARAEFLYALDGLGVLDYGEAMCVCDWVDGCSQ